MAIRQIRTIGDEILTKNCRPVEVIDQRILKILDDMKDTMYAADGVGLAAPQIGVLRSLVVLDVGEGLMEFINPEIIEVSGEQTGTMNVTVRAQNREGKWVEYEGSGLFARCICHEVDHLSGKLFVSKASQLCDTEAE